MKVCVLLPGNMIGGGVKMPVRLASQLVEWHDVTVMYPVVKNYVAYHVLRTTGWAARARHVMAEYRDRSRDFVLKADLDPRVEILEYGRVPDAALLNQYDAIICVSVWQHFELDHAGVRRPRRIHWTLADYLFCSGIDMPVDRIIEAYAAGRQTLVAPSRRTAADLESYGFRVARSIPGGIDPIFSAEGRPVPSATPSILGYFQPRWWVKGAASLIQALTRLRARHPGVRVELFGHQAADIAASGTALCDRFHTNLTSVQVAALCRRHPIFLYPSYSDGFPSPPLEAMACGCAVIATHVGAIPEYATHEQDALLCDPLDHLALSGAVERLLADPVLVQRLGAAAAVSAPRWTWRRCGEAFHQLLTEPESGERP